MTPPAQVDYRRLKAFLESPQGQQMPDALKAKMQQDIASNLGPEGTPTVQQTTPDNPFPVRPDATNVASPQAQVAAATNGDPVTSAAMAPARFAFQLAHDFTAGIVPAMPDGASEWDQKFATPIKLSAGIGAMAAQGSLVVRAGGFALGWLSKVPTVATVLEAIPERLAEVGIGAGVGGAIDAMRPDPQQNVDNPSILDPSSEVANRLNRMGLGPRASMAIGGMVTGGAISGAIMGMVGGFNAARARIIPKLTEADITGIKSSLEQAGIPTTQGMDPTRVAQTFVQNLRKVILHQDVSGVVADQLARESYIANEFIQAGPTPVPPMLMDANGQPVRVYRGSRESHGPLSATEAAKNRLEGSNWFGDGLYFTTSPDEAAHYATRENAPAPNVMPANLRASQVFDMSGFNPVPEADVKRIYQTAVDNGYISEKSLPKNLGATDGFALYEDLRSRFGKDPVAASNKVNQVLQDAGYDAISHPNNMVARGEATGTHYIVFGEHQVQSPFDATGSANIAQAAQFTEQDGRLLSAIFRNNPGAVSIVEGISSPDAVQVARDRLGVNVNSAVIPVPGAHPELLDLHSYGQSLVNDGIVNRVSLIGSKAKNGGAMIGKDTDVLYELPDMQLPASSEDAAQHLMDWMDSHARLDWQKYDTFLKSGDRYFYLNSQAAGPELVENTAYAQQQMKKAMVTVAGDGAITPQQPSYKVIISRPNYEYPMASTVSKVTAKIQSRLANMAKDASKEIGRAPTTETLVLPNGTPIRGGLNTAEISQRMKLQEPVVDGVKRPDLALREFGRFIRMDIPQDGQLVIELPSKITQEQFNSVGRAVDVMKFDQVTVRHVDGTEQLFTQPFGAQVQDGIAQVLKPTSTSSTLDPQLVSQYARTGVFRGQAVVLADGTTGEIMNKSGALYKVRDSITGQAMTVHPSKMTILPTTLAGEMQPSNLFTQYLSTEERNALARLRSSIASGFSQEIQKYSDLEQFANSRGYLATQMKGGRIQLSKVNEGGGQPLNFQSIKAAVEYVRKDNSAVPELTPDKVSQILGPDRNIGFAGGGSPAPRPNELMPIDPARQQASLDNIAKGGGPNSWDLIVKPTIPLMRDLDQKFGTQMYNAMFNVQQATVARDNFLNLWYGGRSGELPNGVLSLQKIQEIAGSRANKEAIFDYLEAAAGTPEKQALAQALKPNELRAADELRKWYNAAYDMFGVNAPFIEDFMPHYRELVQTQGAMGLGQAWQILGNDVGALPKGADWISDHVREGLLDIYSKDPFQVAQQYLRGYAKDRFMSQPLDEARKMVYELASKNKRVALPMAQALQAMSGFEFQEQRAALSQVFGDLISKIPGGGAPHENKQLGDKMVDFLTSAVYRATMGFRPSLALRNAFQAIVMGYPIYGGPRFWEGVGRALTAEGKEEAMAARALSSSPLGMLRQDDPEFLKKLTGPLKQIDEASTLLYDDADQFTRATTYWAAKLRAQDALADFSKEVQKGGLTEEKISGLKRQLIQDTKLYLQGPDVVTEFLRRAGTDPEGAAQYAGKVGADMTNFLYGRGMQPRWMRSVSGRLLGQFGSWSMWYLDYLNRIAGAAVKGEYRGDALRILGRHALVNAALVATGKAMGVDLNKWASYGALFYSGGPGLQLAVGASTLMRGMGDVSTFGESPMGPTRVQEGVKAITSTLPSFVPYFYVGRDALRLAKSQNSTQVLANLLGTNETRDQQMTERIDALLGRNQPAFQSTSPMQAQMLNNQAAGTGVQPVDFRGIPSTPTVGAVPVGSENVPAGVRQRVSGSVPVGLTGAQGSSTPPNVASQLHPGGYSGAVESKPTNF